MSEPGMSEVGAWDVVFADPSKKVKWKGERYELLEGPRWHGADDWDVEADKLTQEWAGKTVVVEAGFPHRNTLLRGVVVAVERRGGRGSDALWCKPMALVRFQVMETAILRSVSMSQLQLYDEPPPERPATNPLMEAARQQEAQAS